MYIYTYLYIYIHTYISCIRISCVSSFRFIFFHNTQPKKSLQVDGCPSISLLPSRRAKIWTMVGPRNNRYKEGSLWIQVPLGGGFKYFVFSPLFGEDCHLDYIIFHCGRSRGKLAEMRHSPYLPHLPLVGKLSEMRHLPHLPHLPL